MGALFIMGTRLSVGHLVAGTVIYITTIAAWILAASRGIDTGPLFYMAGPVVAGLFLLQPLTKAADNAQLAAQQTNGVLDKRIETAVSSALAKRDAARTRQTVGDISTEPTKEEATK